MLKLTGVIVKGFEKANKRGGDGENWRCLASRMSVEEKCKGQGYFKKTGTSNGHSA